MNAQSRKLPWVGTDSSGGSKVSYGSSGMDGAESKESAGGDERWRWGDKMQNSLWNLQKTDRKEEETRRVGWIRFILT